MDSRDQELLREYVRTGSEAAFGQIVERYAQLVYSAAIRSLGDHHLAEDAVQSTFVVLARKAGSLGSKIMLGSWLWKTSTLVCGHMRRAATRRRRRESAAVAAAAESEAARHKRAETVWARLRPLLDEAIHSLPSKARDAVVAHYLMGKSSGELAVEWGVNQSTAAMRVNYGVKRLRERLAAMGVRVSGALLVSVLGSKTVEAVPAGLAAAAQSAAIGMGAPGSGAGAAAAVGGEVIRAMALAKVKLAAYVAVAAAAVAAATPIAQQLFTSPRPQPVQLPVEKPQPAPVRFWTPAKWHPGYYTMVEARRDIPPRTLFRHVRAEPVLAGVCRSYRWSDLEPEEGRYDLTLIASDLEYLESIDKRLFIQLMYKSNSGKGSNVIPAYLRGPAYGGGVYVDGKGGIQAVRWNAAVQARLHALIRAVGARFDGEPYVEGITNVDSSTRIQLPDLEEQIQADGGIEPFSHDAFVESIKAEMSVLKDAFPTSPIIYNLDYLPDQKRTAEIVRHALAIGVGIGGPIRPGDRWLAIGGHKYHPMLSGKVPLGNLVEWYDYPMRRDDGSEVTPEDFLLYGRDRLLLNYIFWRNREPQLSRQVVPVLRRYGNVLDVRRPRCPIVEERR